EQQPDGAADIVGHFPSERMKVGSVVWGIFPRKLFGELLQQRLQLSIRHPRANATAKFGNHTAAAWIVDRLRKVKVGSPIPSKIGARYADDGVCLMIQFQRLTDHVGITVEVSSPKAVMQFNDWLRFLSIRRISRAEVPAEQRRDAQRRKGLPNSVVCVHRFRNVAACHRQVLVTPGGNALEGGKLGYLHELGPKEVFVTYLAPRVPDAHIVESVDISIGKRVQQHAVDDAEDCNGSSDAQRK